MDVSSEPILLHPKKTDCLNHFSSRKDMVCVLLQSKGLCLLCVKGNKNNRKKRKKDLGQVSNMVEEML